VLELLRRGGAGGLSALYTLRSGVRLEALDQTWGAYSPASGATLQLNAEAAAVLELLAEGVGDEDEIARVLASDSATAPETIAALLRDLWPQLLEAGLVERAR
jgi:PqqD family protein of HPr-rel-A system